MLADTGTTAAAAATAICQRLFQPQPVVRIQSIINL
jgi:cobalamin biosynthesis protein CbiD